MLKSVSEQKGSFLKYVLILFLISSCITLFFTSFLQYQLNEVKKTELIAQEQNLIDTESEVIFSKIDMISSDLMYVKDCLQIHEDNKNGYSEVEKLWLAFSDRRTVYDQIRYIDINGDEIIRINYNKDGAVIVEGEELQNKQDRYYFTDSIILDENQIYISKLDLNIENGQIEVPIKPMLRLATPYYVNGELKGVIVLNYYADDMLNQVNKVSSYGNGQLFMLNSDGYWLYDSENSSNEWAFMYEDRSEIRFNNTYPTAWNVLQNEIAGSTVNSDGVFVYTKLITGVEFTKEYIRYQYVLDTGDWILVSHMTSDSDDGLLFTQSIGKMILGVVANDHYIYLIILVTSMIIGALMTVNKGKTEQIKYFSEYDAMTGVYNRRAGFEKLTQLYKKSTETFLISVCFIDINGLKQVNDALGHESGDELIRSVISGIKQNIRANDFVARLGGDEFMIIFEGLDEDQTEEIWERIVKSYDYVNDTENRKYLISVSHGIESFKSDANAYIDAVVNSADEKMYEEKRQIKKDLNVLRHIDNN